MADQKVDDKPKVPPPPPRQPDEALRGYIERANVSRPDRKQEPKGSA